MIELDSVLERVARWQEKDTREPLVEFEAAARRRLPAIEEKVLAALPQATVDARNYLCRQLSVIGTAASVPALARMLREPATADLACYALARIPDHAAAAALRAALPGSSGTLRLSILNALGERRDGKAPGTLAAMRRMSVRQLTAALADSDNNVQGFAIRLLIGSPRVLMERYASMPPIGKVRVLAALGDGADAAARPLITKALQDGSAEIRIAALGALRTLGDASTLAVVAKIAAETTGAEQAAARECLAMMPAKGVGEAIAAAIGSSTGKLRMELIGAAGDRSEAVAGTALLATAKGSDAGAAQAALRAMRSVAGPEHAGALLDLVLTTPGVRRDAASTLASVLRRSGRPDVGAVVDAYRTASDKALRLTLLDVLGQVSAPAALPVVRAALAESDPEIARAAILALTAWQTPEPLPDLMALADKETNAARQVLALRGVVKLVSIPSDRPPAESVALLDECWQRAKQVAEKRAILALLPLFPVAESVALAKRASGDATVEKEAAVSIETLAGLGVR